MRSTLCCSSSRFLNHEAKLVKRTFSGFEMLLVYLKISGLLASGVIVKQSTSPSVPDRFIMGGFVLGL